MSPRFAVGTPGEKFNLLTVVRFSHVRVMPNGRKRHVYTFRCDCGTEVERIYSEVRSGRTKSCGCWQSIAVRRASTRHGFSSRSGADPAYGCWNQMLSRCRYDCSGKNHKNRGIRVCDEWLPGGDGLGFARFREHIGPRPSPRHSIDRIDNNGNYEPGNVRWATPIEQASNQRRNRIVTWGDEQITVAELARRTGLKRSTLFTRIFKRNIPPHQAVMEGKP